MRQIKYSIISALLLSLFSCSAYGQSILEKIKNTDWKGTGVLMNSSATFKMSWTLELDDSFYHLSFESKRMIQTGDEIVFKAHAYYRVANDGIVSGTWFDSRGISFPLKGRANENQLTILWGNEETEQGKTIYSYLGGKGIEVEDYYLTNGKYVRFGTAQYRPNPVSDKLP